MSQSQSGRSVSQPGYPLSARWAVTPPSTCWAAEPSPPVGALAGVPCGTPGYPVLPVLSGGYPGGGGRFSTCYSAVRHSLPSGEGCRSTCMC